MRWSDFQRSDNVEDRRSGGGSFGGGGGGAGLGIGGMIAIGLISYLTGINPAILLGGYEMVKGSRPSEQVTTSPQGRPTDQMGDFVSAILGSTEEQWEKIFKAAGQSYHEPGLVMFRQATRSGCGSAQSAMGPFYCPNDRKIYLDTVFFRELQTRFKGCPAGSAACEFSYAYVIAHEVGHHVQNEMGILQRVERAKRSMNEVEANQMQVRVELQADCFAGVWAYHTQAQYKAIDAEDIRAALQTAAAIGDDMLQKKAQGYVVPDSFTHGTSQQRQRWFTQGFKSGQVQSCNTFRAASL